MFLYSGWITWWMLQRPGWWQLHHPLKFWKIGFVLPFKIINWYTNVYNYGWCYRQLLVKDVFRENIMSNAHSPSSVFTWESGSEGKGPRGAELTWYMVHCNNVVIFLISEEDNNTSTDIYCISNIQTVLNNSMYLYKWPRDFASFGCNNFKNTVGNTTALQHNIIIQNIYT